MKVKEITLQKSKTNRPSLINTIWSFDANGLSFTLRFESNKIAKYIIASSDLAITNEYTYFYYYPHALMYPKEENWSNLKIILKGDTMNLTSINNEEDIITLKRKE